MKTLSLLATILLIAAFPVCSQQLPAYIEWQKCLGGTGDDIANVIIKTTDGGFLVAGSSKSNNGDVTGHHGSADSLDAWVVKISSAGDIQWQRSYGGSGVDVFETVIALSDGNYICYGSTTSNDGDVVGNHGKADFWVVKLDQSGQILWQKCFGGSRDEFTGNMRLKSDGGFYVIGTSKSNDGDVSHGKPAYQGINYTDIWVLKLDASGNLIREDTYGTMLDDSGHDIIETGDGYYMTIFSSNHDEVFLFQRLGEDPSGWAVHVFDGLLPDWGAQLPASFPVSITPSGNHHIITFRNQSCGGASTNFRMIAGKLTRPYNYYTGQIELFAVFGSCIATPNWLGYYVEGPHNYAILDSVDNHINVGTYDTVPGVSTTHGDYDGFLASYRSNGDINWKKYIGGSGKEFLTGVTPLSETEFIVCGYTNSNNDDVSGNHGGFDVWVVKFGAGNAIKGTVFADINGNGSKEANEPLMNNVKVESVKGSSRNASVTSEGLFVNAVDTGTYITEVVNHSPYYTPPAGSKTSSFNTYNSTDSVSFGMYPIPGKKDYQVQLFPATIARPGGRIKYVITCSNAGTDTLINRTLTFIKDARLTFQFASPAHSSINGDTIRWTMNNILPANSASIIINFGAAIPPALNMNDTLHSEVLIDPTGDLTPSDNASSLRQRVVGSFDPNDKQEAHAGYLLPQEYSSGKPLLYTIRFQNTGNDTAFNVVVRDTLEAKLNWNSFEMVDASHNFQTEIKDGNKITWTFNDILLPDSNVNEPASHGYITYRVKPVTGLQIGDVIHNSASIYFDYNLPVKTNTTETIITLAPPATPTIVDLQANYCNTLGVVSAKIANLPPAGGGTSVTVKIDANTVGVGADSTFSFNVSTLAAGAHTVSVQYSNSGGNRLSSAGFNVTEAVTPDVNVQSNITTITNLATPVILTGTNAAGGGAGPLYTFARDRNFTNISQAESVNNTWTFDPSILAIGDNMIYIRMKSNASCVVATTVTDSVLLKRSSVTGINDPDMPGQVINIYPNPFRDVIMIKGLSAAKTYTVMLYNLEGKQIVSRRVSNRSTLNITRQHQATGTYWLSIYDEKRKQLLGTVKLLKQ
jgi:uncharacterized repeat protein (TIGR01451 family)